MNGVEGRVDYRGEGVPFQLVGATLEHEQVGHRARAVAALLGDVIAGDDLRELRVRLDRLEDEFRALEREASTPRVAGEMIERAADSFVDARAVLDGLEDALSEVARAFAEFDPLAGDGTGGCS